MRQIGSLKHTLTEKIALKVAKKII